MNVFGLALLLLKISETFALLPIFIMPQSQKPREHSTLLSFGHPLQIFGISGKPSTQLLYRFSLPAQPVYLTSLLFNQTYTSRHTHFLNSPIRGLRVHSFSIPDPYPYLFFSTRTRTRPVSKKPTRPVSDPRVYPYPYNTRVTKQSMKN